MVKDLVRGMQGLGLTIDDIVDRFVVAMKITTTKNNVINIVVVLERVLW